MMTTTRRLFLGGAASLALWPRNLFGTAGAQPAEAGIWENPDGTATDCVLARRLHLDLAGRIPTKEEAQAYARSTDPGKRAALVDRLLASDAFADYWTMRFCDVLRVKSEFPINLWPNAVYVYHARIRAFVAGNEPWDAFGRALLTAQGSDFRDAEANFFRATDRRTPEGWAEAAAQTFLGLPPAQLSAARRAELAAFFANVRIKDTREWKEEVVYVEGEDRRGALCDQLFGTARAETAAAFQRLVRGWIFGPDAPEVPSPGEFRLKDLLRGIVLSDEYARGSVTGGFPARRLDAEVLDDAFCALSGSVRDLQSPAPEPFTFLPPKRATVCVEDGSISNGFLTLFGRPARDTGLPEERGLEVTAKQRLYLFNSGRLHGQLGRIVAPGPWRKGGGKGAGAGDAPASPVYSLSFGERVEDLYWKLLGRAPSARERGVVRALWERRGGLRRKRPARPYETLRDVAWCLVNTKEFLFRI